MKVKSKVVDKYKTRFFGKNLNFIMLQNDTSDIERVKDFLIRINSDFLFPIDNDRELTLYCEKLIHNGRNFILESKQGDIGIISIYVNDFETKTAFTSTIGVLPSFRQGGIASYFVDFAIEFAREQGMEFYRAEISKENVKWLSFLKMNKFEIESETKNNSYIIIRKLK